MASESFFTRITNEVLEASERLATRLEEGLSVLLDGVAESPSKTNDHSKAAPIEDEDFEIGDDDMMESPLQGISDGVIDDIMKMQVGPQTPLEHIQAFQSAITWSEPFILSLIAFQLVAFLLCIWVTRPNRGLVPRIGFMVIVGVVVRSAEYLNTLGAQHWEKFSTQNYFDRSGIFMGIMLCAPLLVDCFLMLILYLREASQLLVRVKKEEIKKKKKSKAKNGENNKNKKSSKKED